MPAKVYPGMTDEAVLADPASHAGIDGTGWVREALDGQLLSQPGQLFRMAMYHDNHPDGDYEMSNKVTVLDRPRTIAWEPGQAGPSGEIGYGGWIWRYDLTPRGQDGCHAYLRLVCGAGGTARAHPISAVRPNASGEFAESPRRADYVFSDLTASMRAASCSEFAAATTGPPQIRRSSV